MGVGTRRTDLRARPRRNPTSGVGHLGYAIGGIAFSLDQGQTARRGMTDVPKEGQR